MSIFTVRERCLQLLLIQRKVWPFEGRWALPGGFVRPGETLEEAARRELSEETGVGNVFLEQLRAFGDPGRDPRTWVITVAHTALIPSDRLTLRADTDAADAGWFPLSALPGPLAFDHQAILDYALSSLRADSKKTCTSPAPCSPPASRSPRCRGLRDPPGPPLRQA